LSKAQPRSAINVGFQANGKGPEDNANVDSEVDDDDDDEEGEAGAVDGSMKSD